MAWFLNQISIGGVGLFAQAAASQGETPAQVVNDFEAILKKDKLSIPGARRYPFQATAAEQGLASNLDSQILSYYPPNTTLPAGSITFNNFSQSDAVSLVTQMLLPTGAVVQGTLPNGDPYTYPLPAARVFLRLDHLICFSVI